jgi:hypothetical protein
MVHCRIHRSHPLVPILRQTNPVIITPSYFAASILVSLAHLRLFLPSVNLLCDIQSLTYTRSCPYSCCMPGPSHPILLDFIVLITLGEGCKSRSSSLCSFLYTPVSLALSSRSIPYTTYAAESVRIREKNSQVELRCFARVPSPTKCLFCMRT